MKKRSKYVAKERIMQQVNFALGMASRDLPRSKAALASALKILKRYNIKGASIFRRYFWCHKCKEVVVPGRTATVRISSGKVKTLAVTCLMCKKTYRIPLIKKVEASKRGPDAG